MYYKECVRVYVASTHLISKIPHGIPFIFKLLNG